MFLNYPLYFDWGGLFYHSCTRTVMWQREQAPEIPAQQNERRFIAIICSLKQLFFY